CPTPRTGMEIVRFGDEEMVVVTAPEHPIAGLEEVGLRELERQPFIAFSDEITTRKLADQRLRGAGVNMDGAMSLAKIEAIKNLVEIGTGIALLPENTVRQEVREGTLSVVRLEELDRFRRPAGILVKQGRARRAAVRAFVEAMREY